MPEPEGGEGLGEALGDTKQLFRSVEPRRQPDRLAELVKEPGEQQIPPMREKNIGGLVCASHRRKNRGFPTLKRTLDLGTEKGRLFQNSRPNVGGYTRYFSVRMPENH